MKADEEVSWLALHVARLLRTIPLMSGCGKIANKPALRAIAKSNKEVWVRARYESSILCYLDDYVGRALFYFGDLDPKLSWVLKKILKPGDRFVDVGANVGLLTFLGAKLVGKTGRVLAIEPQPKVLACLERAIARNEAGNVEVGAYALGSAPGRLTLHVPVGNLGGASLYHIPQSEADAVDVEIKTLAEVVQGTPFEKAKLVKLDVEGAEEEVIKGARPVWEKNPPEVVVFEFREEGKVSKSKPGKLLAEMGYHFFQLPRNWFRPCLVVADENAPAKSTSHDVIAIHRTAPYDPIKYFNRN